ncbi:MAG: hypothetical protein AAF998_18250 [Bacteroidota bacterium]
MKTLIWIILLVSFSGATAQSTLSLDDYRLRFWSQISGTCQGTVKLEKVVRELDEGETTASQRKVFLVDCPAGAVTNAETGQPDLLHPTDFSELFAYDFADPFIKDYLQVNRTGPSLTAAVREASSGKTPLQKQVFEVDADTGVLRYAEIKVAKHNLLYDFELHSRIWFDEVGRYTRHTIETYTYVVLSGSVRTRIEGKILS